MWHESISKCRVGRLEVKRSDGEVTWWWGQQWSHHTTSTETKSDQNDQYWSTEECVMHEQCHSQCERSEAWKQIKCYQWRVGWTKCAREISRRNIPNAYAIMKVSWKKHETEASNTNTKDRAPNQGQVNQFHANQWQKNKPDQGCWAVGAYPKSKVDAVTEAVKRPAVQNWTIIRSEARTARRRRLRNRWAGRGMMEEDNRWRGTGGPCHVRVHVNLQTEGITHDTNAKGGKW
jgi:hypothetical protein